MTTEKRKLVRRLNLLFRLCDASARGFLVVSENAGNRGLKIVLKSFAFQRSDFADQLKDEIRRYGGDARDRRSLRGIIHRGRMTIRAALTIGPRSVEKVVLGEALKGENAIIQAYVKTLKEDLPDDTRNLIEQQYEGLKKVRSQVAILRGIEGQRTIVHLFDSVQAAESAHRQLEAAGFDLAEAEVEDIPKQLTEFAGSSNTISEAALSGALGGAIWGSIIGAIAGATFLLLPEGTSLMGGYWSTWAVLALVGTGIGALFGAILGFLIGHSAAEEDAFLYEVGLQEGGRLLQLQMNQERVEDAERILRSIEISGYREDPNWQATGSDKQPAVQN